MQPDRVPTESPPAGWYADPAGSGLRWWDGREWTDSTQPPQDHHRPSPSPGSYYRPTRNPSPMDAWNGLMTGGHLIIVALLLIAFVGLLVMLVATVGGASAASAQAIAAKVIVYGGLALLGFRFFASR